MRIDYKKLENARKNKGYKLKEAARMIGIPFTVLKKWETGKGKSPFEYGHETLTTRAILEVYGIKIEELYFDVDIERLNKTFEIML